LPWRSTPARSFALGGFTVDQWQTDVLLSRDRQLLLNCCRQAGKSTVVSAVALYTALFQPGSLTLILSPGQRQSSETFKKVIEGDSAISRPRKADYETQLRIELANNSHILCMPGVEENVRCYSPNLIIIDEAARVPDDLYRAIRPMLAVSQGRRRWARRTHDRRATSTMPLRRRRCWSRRAG
jgi:tRNA(Met) C34 N-acetyltransferase TmcA